MDLSDVSSEFVVDESGSRLLSESLVHPSTSSRGGGGSHDAGDLSLSELSLTDPSQPPPHRRRPFSLLAQPRSPSPKSFHLHGSALAEEEEEYDEEVNDTMTPEDAEKARRAAGRTREEKLQSDLFMLKKLNSAFEVYKEALRETKNSTERVADQLTHTNALLDKYVNILSKSERVTKLILDERWQGADADEEQLEREAQEEMERIRREEEERARLAQLEKERLEREEQERQAQLERERRERERAEAAKTTSRGSGVRGVRGTRASMRGVRGSAVPRPASISANRASPTTSSGGSIPVRRTTASSISRGSASARPSSISRKT
ncbi:DASH complex subunit Duo1-domain-containing protein [Phanerochaete sordida]|uniref:DASH complex subunit DUO1 n=1 Tax=Phanerochaete sordida TaxID=48140 RepID=A0A9P3GL27_9APHY|nr:DASH complex subunit Duo1-domain-containing protein [Phanerochaete sordida]